MAALKPPIAFIHLPRTGGNSLREAAKIELGDRYFPLKVPSDVPAELAARIPDEVELIIGHMNHGLHRYRPVRYATALREPISRTLSNYQIWRVQRARRGQAAPFDGPDQDGKPFIRKHYSDNVQTRMIAGCFRADPLPSADEALAAAKRNLETFAFVGFSHNLAAVGAALGLRRIGHVNSFKRDFELNKKQLEAIRERNWADLALFDWAIHRFG